VQNELSASGELLDHKELALDNAKIVRTERRIFVITNGPFAGDKEILGGYYLVDCVSLERATEIAGRFLEAEFAPIEVRRLSGDTSWDTGAPTVEPKGVAAAGDTEDRGADIRLGSARTATAFYNGCELQR
jgi:hypothetical protein